MTDYRSINSLSERFADAALYGITSFVEWTYEELHRVDEACRGGVDVIQLRAKTFDRVALRKVGLAIREITRARQKLFIVNDYPDLARDVRADGVHLGQADLSVAEARTMLGDRPALIGKSTHSVKQIRDAGREGADYIGVGPVYATPTKPDYAAVGLALIREAALCSALPFVAIGGIDAVCIENVLSAGARRIAVVRALFGSDQVFERAKELKKRIHDYDKCRGMRQASTGVSA